MRKDTVFKLIQNYRVLCAEIRRKEAKIQQEKLHVVDAVQTAAEHPYWLHTIPIEGDIYPADVNDLRREVARKKAQTAYVLRYVQEIENYKIKRAVEIKYIEPADEVVTWEKVADELADGSTGDSIRKLIYRHFSEK